MEYYIQKSKDTETNTWEVKVNGLVAGKRLRPAIITAIFTTDDYGETLSFCYGDFMYTVPFEGIIPLVERARKEAAHK